MNVRNKSIGERVRVFQMFDKKGSGFADYCMKNTAGVTIEHANNLCAVFGVKPSTVFAQISFDDQKIETSSFILSQIQPNFNMIDIKNNCMLDDSQQAELIGFENVLSILAVQNTRIFQHHLVTLMMKTTGLSDQACMDALLNFAFHDFIETIESKGRVLHKISEAGRAYLQGNRPWSTQAAATNALNELAN